MWTEQSRGRMAKIAKKTKRYPSDLTDEEWEAIAPLMPQPGRRGRPREVEFREVINAVRYLVRSGCGWRMLPAHFGHWRTVYGWFRELARRVLFAGGCDGPQHFFRLACMHDLLIGVHARSALLQHRMGSAHSFRVGKIMSMKETFLHVEEWQPPDFRAPGYLVYLVAFPACIAGLGIQ